MRVATAAKGYVGLSTIVIGFQLALAAGAPRGELTMGGAFRGQLPPRMRLAALASAVLLLAMCVVVVASANLAVPRWQPASRRLVWLVVAYTVIGVALNAATPSVWERVVWLPVAILLAACALVVARGESPAG